MDKTNEVDAFLDFARNDTSRFEDKVEKPIEKIEEEVKEEDGGPRKNRAYRRLEEKYQKERETAMELAAILKDRSERESVHRQADETKLDPDLLRAFGTTDEGKELARIFTEKLEHVSKTAREQAIEEFRSVQSQSIAEQKGYESQIDSQLEALEDEYDVDLTSEKAKKTRQEFLSLVGQLSPKDENGDIKDYADFGTTYELFQKMNKKEEPETRNKEFSSRSMTKSGSVNLQAESTAAMRQYLKENGIKT